MALSSCLLRTLAEPPPARRLSRPRPGTVGLERREQLPVAERLARRREADLARRLVDEMVRGEGLDQARLQVGALAVRGHADRLEVAAPDDDVDGALQRRFSRGGEPGCIESAIPASICLCSSGGSGLIFSW